jgi:predicted membrane-bound mannosyltransferase
VIALRGVVEYWPFGNGVSAALFLLAAGAAAMSPDTWAVVPALAVMALLCAWSIGRHDRQGTRLLASRHFRRAMRVPHASKCELCGRAHLNGARFAECQYGNCRRPLEPRHTCTCDGCVALDAVGQKREGRAFMERLEKIGDGDEGGFE